ncbi:MAG: cyclic nucleotide-binding domain-containing protein [Myxococcales bacterium]|nr:cyclic nucleotide-binding domain-containing protein [Myxococcales bacterium]
MADPRRRGGLSVKALLDHGVDWLLDTTFLGKLEAADQAAVLARASWHDFGPNAVIVEADVARADVHLIVAGQALVTANEQVLARLGPGHLVGERAHLRGERTAARVTTLSPTRTLRIAGADFAELLASVDALHRYVTDLVDLRDRSVLLLDLLLRDPVLRSLGREDLEALLQAGQLVRLPAGEPVLTAGGRNHDVYLVVRGRVAVFSRGAGGARELLTTNGPGWLFGYAALLLDVPRTADIETTEATELLRVRDRAFMELVSRNPPLQRRLYKQLADLDLRTDQARALVSKALVAAVWSRHPRLGTTTLAYGLAAALRDRGPAAVVDLGGAETAARLRLATSADVVDGVPVVRAAPPPAWGAVDVLWPEDPTHTAPLVRALAGRFEDGGSVVVALRDAAAPDAATIAAAETVVFLRWADDASSELALEHGGHRVDAVRLQAGVELPMATTRNAVRVPPDAATVDRFWAARDLDALVSPARPLGRAVDRLGRVLQGRTVGVALGGGGALGFAHVSLLRALHAQGVPIDYVAGSSFGSVVGGLYASGGLALLDELVDQAAKVNTLALGAMLSLSPLERWVRKVTHGRALGTTEIPFFPVALDVLGGQEVVITRGSVAEGVRASCGFPLFYPALPRGVRRLVDGGIINNVPASVIWDAGANFIVGANIIPRFPAGRGARLGSGLLSWVEEHTVARFDDLLRSVFMMMSQMGRDRASRADYVFDLELEGYLISDFRKGAEIMDAAMQQAEEAAASIAILRDRDASLRLGQR